MEKNKQIGLAILVLVLVGGGAFFGGLKYGVAKQVAADDAARAARGGNRLGGNRNGGAGGANVAGNTGNQNFGGGTVGSILSKDATSITVKLVDGGSQIIFVASSTPIMKSATGSAADLIVGANVVVRGTKNQDGSLTAQNIQLRP